jgi:hypothetical protein
MSACDVAPDRADRAAADLAAREWLELVDGGKYAESWEAAAPVFKGAIDSAKWTSMVQPIRAPMGSLVSRDLASAALQTEMPGAPDGKYVILTYRSKFTNKRSAVETITPYQTPDGAWRVSGYFIR